METHLEVKRQATKDKQKGWGQDGSSTDTSAWTTVALGVGAEF